MKFVKGAPPPHPSPGRGGCEQEELAVEPASPPRDESRGKDAAKRRNPAKAGSKEAKARTGLAEGHPDRTPRRAAGDRASVPPAEPRTEDKQPWPKDLPERIAAVRDLVLSTRAGWTAETVARSFKNGQATSAEKVLDSLAALGLLVRYEKNGERMWKAAGRPEPRANNAAG